VALTKNKKNVNKKKSSSNKKTKSTIKASDSKKTLIKKNVKAKSSKKKLTKNSPIKSKLAVKQKSSIKKAKSKNTTSVKTTAKISKKNKIVEKDSKKLSTKPKGKAWLRPLDDRLLIEITDEPKKSPGGIILIDSTEQVENLQGFVIAVGRGHQGKKGRIRPIEAKTGDKVIFSKYSGDKISHDGVNFVVIRETDVLGFASN